MVEAIWFYARGSQQQGPTDLQTLREMIHHGQLMASELVWRNGMPDWLPAGQVPELADAFGPGPDQADLGAEPGVGTSGALPPPPLSVPPPPGYGVPPQQQPVQALPYGQPAGYGYYGNAGVSYANDARTAMIISIIGIFCIGIILGPIGIVLGNAARRNMRASGNMEGEGMAVAAIVIGWIIVGIAVAGILFFVLFGFLGVMAS